MSTKIRLMLIAFMLFFSVVAVRPAHCSEKIILTSQNMFRLDDVVNDQMADDFINKVLTYKEKTMYVYIYSPGGSVNSGLRMISAMHGHPEINFICIADVAISMAFNFLQYCPTRIVMEHSQLMSHNISGAFRGELPRVESDMTPILSTARTLNKNAAKRMKIPVEKYEALINNQLWLDAALSLKMHAADILNDRVSCAEDLLVPETVIREVNNGGQTIQFKVTRSACPLLTNIISAAPILPESTEPAPAGTVPFIVPAPSSEGAQPTDDISVI